MMTSISIRIHLEVHGAHFRASMDHGGECANCLAGSLDVGCDNRGVDLNNAHGVVMIAVNITIALAIVILLCASTW
jgi:hypothetical protein